MVVAGNNKPEAAPTPERVLSVGTTTTKYKLTPLTVAKAYPVLQAYPRYA